MDGKIFLWSTLTPPQLPKAARTDAFNFDLQRFTSITIGDTTIESSSQVVGKDSSGNDVKQEVYLLNPSEATTYTLTSEDPDKSFQIDKPILIEGDVTIDLNGCTLENGYSDSAINILNVKSGTLTIKDTSSTGNGAVASSGTSTGEGNAFDNCVVYVAEGATLNVESCQHITNVDTSTYNSKVNIINSYGDVNIKGGCVYGQYNVPVIQNLGSGTVLIDADASTTPYNYNVWCSGKPTESAIANKADGKVVVKNGVIRANNVTSISNASNAGYAISNTDGSTGTISVEGGTIDAGKAISNYSTAQEAVVISGGTINGQSHENAANEFYTIANHSTGGIKISDNASITLKVNENTSDKYSDKNKENVAVYNEAGGNVSITGGTIDLQRKAVAVCNAGTGTVDVSGGTLTGSASGAVGIRNNAGGTVEVSGGTITTQSANAIENNSTGIVNVSGGNITTSRGSAVSNSNANGTVNVSGGTIGASTNAIDNAGHVNVSGTAVISSTGSTRDNAGIYNKTLGIVSISGGSVTSEQFYGIFLATNFRNKIYVSGGTVEGGTYAIYDQSRVAATISLSGGTYNGQLATKNTKATNYTISGAPTFNSNTLLSASSTLLRYASGTGSDSLIGAEGWNATETDNQFFNLSTTDSIYGTKDFTLSNVTTPLNVNIDDTVKVAGVPISDVVSGQTPALSGSTDYKITTLEYNTGKTSATVETFDNAVSITSAVLGSKVATVSGAGNAYTLYIEGSDTLKNITGSDNNDTLKAGDSGSTLIGDEGSDLLIGGDGADTFVYSAGADSIQGYAAGDLVSVKGLQPSLASFSVSGDSIKLDFEGSDNLTFNAFDSGVSLQSGKNTYVYKKDYYTFNDKGITLAAGYSVAFAGASTAYETIDASAVSVTGGIFVTGNSLDNVIFGSTVNGGSLYGGAGNDKLDVTERSKDAKYVFQYTAGKDTVDGFVGSSDSLAIDLDTLAIAGAKTGNDRLTFNFSDSKNALVLKGDALEKISLSGGTNYLTKDGVVSGTSLKLFASAKGLIDLKEDTIYSGTGIESVNAQAASKPITLVGGTQGGSFTFATNNKKRDVFEYGGGSVTISGYESGTDKINLGDTSISGFTVNGDDVLLTVGEKTISLVSAKDKEVLIHDASSKSNSYAKMVFKATGILENKEKRPTEATVLAGASGYEASNTIKKVFVMGGVSGVNISAGNNKTTLNASAADGVILIGGNKNDKLIGSTEHADMFVYSGGKDEIQNFGADDEINLDGDFNFEGAKITASKRSYKFKFGGRGALAIKGESLSGEFNINGETKTFAKNAIGDGKGNVSLTSSFSGTYKIDDDNDISNVDGSQVKKNLTFKGTEEAETFTGGTKKTKFNGGGGNDTLIGNDNGKDTFFYAKGDSGEVTIEKFDFSKDKLKIASNTISEISTVSGGVKFDMSDGSFTVKDAGSETLIKANSTYYWFAQSDGEDINGNSFDVGALITADTKVKKGDASGFAVIDLGYSTNLVKTNVAVKVANAKPNQS